jgi:predicted nucleic acid-binding protein
LILVDTNVLIDIAQDDPVWADWSVSQLRAASLIGPLVINDVIYAELSVDYDDQSRLDDFVARAGLRRQRIPDQALFLAGKAFLRYRGAGGTRPNVLADFFIGAHAAVTGMPLLTRDVRRYRSYFPTVALIAPNPA